MKKFIPPIRLVERAALYVLVFRALFGADFDRYLAGLFRLCVAQ